MLAEIAIVYAFGGSILAPLPAERVLALEPAWLTVPSGWALQVTLQDGDVICAESGATRECAMARLGRVPFSGLVVEVRGPARWELLACSRGSRKGRAYVLDDPGYAVAYHVVAHEPPQGRCWWDAWCVAAGGGKP